MLCDSLRSLPCSPARRTGKTATRPHVWIHVHRDSAPVSIVSPENRSACPAGECTITEVRFRAQDDLAVSKAELVVTARIRPAHARLDMVFPIPLGSQKDAKQIAGYCCSIGGDGLREGDLNWPMPCAFTRTQSTAASSDLVTRRSASCSELACAGELAEKARSVAAGQPLSHRPRRNPAGWRPTRQNLRRNRTKAKLFGTAATSNGLILLSARSVRGAVFVQRQA